VFRAGSARSRQGENCLTAINMVFRSNLCPQFALATSPASRVWSSFWRSSDPTLAAAPGGPQAPRRHRVPGIKTAPTTGCWFRTISSGLPRLRSDARTAALGRSDVIARLCPTATSVRMPLTRGATQSRAARSRGRRRHLVLVASLALRRRTSRIARGERMFEYCVSMTSIRISAHTSSSRAMASHSAIVRTFRGGNGCATS
jgi:hypothetical protein